MKTIVGWKNCFIVSKPKMRLPLQLELDVTGNTQLTTVRFTWIAPYSLQNDDTRSFLLSIVVFFYGNFHSAKKAYGGLSHLHSQLR
jgi:hypothetical protein